MKKLLRRFIAHALRHTTAFPLWSSLEIDIQSSCNRDCDFCPRYLDRSGVRKDAAGKPVYRQMPTEQVYRIIDQAHALGFRGRTKLHRLSEGLLDERYLEFAAYIRDKGMLLVEDTNGDLLRTNSALCARLDGLVQHLTIGLYDYRSELEKQQQMLFWRNRFKKTRLSFSLPREQCLIRQGSGIYDQAPKNRAVLSQPCNQPACFLLIRYDGNVSLCCEDDHCRFALGNAFSEDLAGIWWSWRHITIARTLQKAGGRQHYGLCRQCYMHQERINLLDDGQQTDSLVNLQF